MRVIYSFSGVKDKDGISSTLNRNRKAMKDRLLLSFPTLSRSIANLTAKGYVSRLSHDEYIFNRDGFRFFAFLAPPIRAVKRVNAFIR